MNTLNQNLLNTLKDCYIIFESNKKRLMAIRQLKDSGYTFPKNLLDGIEFESDFDEFPNLIIENDVENDGFCEFGLIGKDFVDLDSERTLKEITFLQLINKLKLKRFDIYGGLMWAKYVKNC